MAPKPGTEQETSMTIEEQAGLVARPTKPDGSRSEPSTAENGGASAREKASAAADESKAVASTAVEAGKDVAHTAAEQATAVAGQAKEQLGVVVSKTKDEFRSQIDARGQQAASGLQTLASQLGALAHGRPDEAGHVGTLVGDAQQRVQSYAQSLQQRGPQAIVDDIASYARRRPLRFLMAAAVTGFAAGRLARAEVAVHKEQQDQTPRDSGSQYRPDQGPLIVQPDAATLDVSRTGALSQASR
jgi:hypothetical protein